MSINYYYQIFIFFALWVRGIEKHTKRKKVQFCLWDQLNFFYLKKNPEMYCRH